MKENTKFFMVSYMENGIRKKFLVQAPRKTAAITLAEGAGADPAREKSVQELNRDVNTY